MYEWNRRQLWSSPDAKQTRTRAWLSLCVIGLLPLAITAISVATIECYYADDERRVPANPAPAECVRDADCALVPSLITCCGECEPAPPFEAVTKPLLEAVRNETDAQCAPATRIL